MTELINHNPLTAILLLGLVIVAFGYGAGLIEEWMRSPAKKKED